MGDELWSRSMKVAELRACLRERGLSTAGVKADLVARLDKHPWRATSDMTTTVSCIINIERVCARAKAQHELPELP